MQFMLDEKFYDYVSAVYVSPDIPDDLLDELKKINEEWKKKTGREHFDFPR